MTVYSPAIAEWDLEGGDFTELTQAEFHEHWRLGFDNQAPDFANGQKDFALFVWDNGMGVHLVIKIWYGQELTKYYCGE